MTLAELSPRWVSEEGRHGQALSFLCPHCREVRLFVPFNNPLDGGEPMPDPGLKGRWSWAASGDTFETLTLTPSVDASSIGHWHGYIKDGEVTSC